MKNLTKMKAVQKVAIIAIITVIGFSMIACDLNDDDPPSFSLNGIWESSGGTFITISSNSGVYSAIGTTSSALTQDAVNKGYITLGGQYLRNLTSTGNLTWSGETSMTTFNLASPNVATGTAWGNCTITMNANGQTIDVTSTGTTIVTSTFTRSNYKLNGVWEASGNQITINGNNGTFSLFGSNSTLWTDAINKNYLTIGGQYLKSITSTGTLTWSGQVVNVTYNNASPNVATGTAWANCTITLNTTGQTMTLSSTDSGGTNTTNFTRRR